MKEFKPIHSLSFSSPSTIKGFIKVKSRMYKSFLVFFVSFTLSFFFAVPAYAIDYGNVSIGTSLDSNNSNHINGSKITTTSAANIVSMSVYVGNVDPSAANRSYQLAIYTNTGSAPGALMASSATGTLVANSWNTLPINASLLANTTYWLMYNTNGTTTAVNNMRYNSGVSGVGAFKVGTSTFGAWPATLGTSTLSKAVYSLYATTGGSGGTDTIAPTVSITAPSASASVSGTITISATANDNASVPTVQFQLDSSNLGSLLTSSPYNLSWNTALHSSGTHVLTAIARDASGNQTVSAPVSVTISNTDVRSQVGEWSPLASWPIVAIHANLLKTGKVLVWDHESASTGPLVWDPATAQLTSTPFLSEELFCASQINLADGRVLSVGGHRAGGGEDGIKSTYIYDPDANTWTQTGNMAFDRWYPGLTKLADGRLFITSGQIVTGTFANTPEIYDPSTGLSTTIPSINTSQLHEEEYPAQFHLPNGKILAISPEHGPVQLLSTDASTWTNVNTTPVLLGSAVQYRPGKILMSGGAPTLGSTSTSVKLAAVLDMNAATPAWRNVAPMSLGRYMHNLVMLPTGKVLAVGGATVAYQQSGSGTLPSEIWDPTTETWTTVASLSAPRVYHSTALLLPDGRVLAAGGGRNHQLPSQLSAQVYSPPYLFKGNRPTISNAPSALPYGTTAFTVDTPDAANIASVALIANGSVTHSNDFNQFYMELPFTASAGQLSVTRPLNGNQVPPGHYMLFIVNSEGVPSVARIVKVGSAVPSLSIVTNALPEGVIGTAYSSALAATGGVAPYTWSISAGGLPTGLSLNTGSGLISGTPTVAGTFNFTVRVVDSNGGNTTRNLGIIVGSSQTTRIGLTTIGNLQDSHNSNVLHGSKVTTTNGGNIVSMSAYIGNVDANTANRNFQFAIYANNGNLPGALVASSAIGTLVANSWNTLAINTTLQPNTTYWLMYNTNGRTSVVNNMRYNSGSSGQGMFSTSAVNFGAWPANAPISKLTSAVYSLYATFEP